MISSCVYHSFAAAIAMIGAERLLFTPGSITGCDPEHGRSGRTADRPSPMAIENDGLRYCINRSFIPAEFVVR